MKIEEYEDEDVDMIENLNDKGMLRYTVLTNVHLNDKGMLWYTLTQYLFTSKWQRYVPLKGVHIKYLLMTKVC